MPGSPRNFLPSKISARESDFQQPGAIRTLPGDKRGAGRRAALSRVPLGERVRPIAPRGRCWACRSPSGPGCRPRGEWAEGNQAKNRLPIYPRFLLWSGPSQDIMNWVSWLLSIATGEILGWWIECCLCKGRCHARPKPGNSPGCNLLRGAGNYAFNGNVCHTLE